MSNQNDALMAILPDIQRAARHVSLEWADVVGAEDLEQDIAVRLLENDYARTVADMEVPQRKRALYKIGTQLASRARTDLEHFSGNFRYSTTEVRSLLQRGALTSEGFRELDGVYTSTTDHRSLDYDPAPVPAVELQTDVIDLRVAFGRLAENHREVLIARFVEGRLLDGTQRKEATRAVDALTAEMNRAFRRGHAAVGR